MDLGKVYLTEDKISKEELGKLDSKKIEKKVLNLGKIGDDDTKIDTEIGEKKV